MGFWDWLMGTPPDDPTAERRPKARTAQERATARYLRVGDVVTYDGIDYLVKNQITYRAGAFEWYDFFLIDDATDQITWLSVEDSKGLTLTLFRDGALCVPEVPPVPRMLQCEGHDFRLAEHGEATVELEKDDPRRSIHDYVEYWSFVGPGGRSLRINRWGDAYEVSLGRSIKEYDLSILPARV